MEECVCKEAHQMDGIFGLASVALRLYLEGESFYNILLFLVSHEGFDVGRWY